MSKAEEPILKEAKEDDFTCITFQPDLAKFKMTRLDDDIVALMSRRAYDIAASTPGVKVIIYANLFILSPNYVYLIAFNCIFQPLKTLLS